MMTKIRVLIIWVALFGMVVVQTPLPVSAQEASATEAPPARVYTAEELDTLLGPIALYPDPLLAQILPAATAPHDVVMAARYVAAKKDPEQIDQQPWEESVKALARYPDVIKMMDEKLDWTTELGEAFIAQPGDVFDSVQRLRAQAQAVGNLKDSPQQVIVKETEVIKIMPADPQVIYVPQYPPTTVYTTPPADPTVPLLAFGVGLAMGAWIHNEVDWHNHDVYYHNSGWNNNYHGGGGNYGGGGNNITINNNNNVNVGNGNGNANRPANGNGGGSAWKPQTKPKPTPYGAGNGTQQRSNNGANPGAGGNQQRPANGNNAQQRPAQKPNQGQGAQQKPAQKPSQAPKPQQKPAAQPKPRPSTQPSNGASREGTKARPADAGNRGGGGGARAGGGGGGGGRGGR